MHTNPLPRLPGTAQTVITMVWCGFVFRLKYHNNKSCFKLFWVVGWVVVISISVYLTYHQIDTISLVLNLYQAEQNFVQLSIFQLKVKLGCGDRSKQIPIAIALTRLRVYKSTLLCEFFRGAMTYISMFKRSPNHT